MEEILKHAHETLGRLDGFMNAGDYKVLEDLLHAAKLMVPFVGKFNMEHIVKDVSNRF